MDVSVPPTSADSEVSSESVPGSELTSTQVDGARKGEIFWNCSSV